MSDKPVGPSEALARALSAMLMADSNAQQAFVGWLERYGYCIAPLKATDEMADAMACNAIRPDRDLSYHADYEAAIAARPKVTP